MGFYGFLFKNLRCLEISKTKTFNISTANAKAKPNEFLFSAFIGATPLLHHS